MSSDTDNVEIDPTHLGNINVLMPIEPFVNLVLSKYSSTGDFKRQPTDQDRKKALSYFRNRNIFFAGQIPFILATFFPRGVLRSPPLKAAMEELHLPPLGSFFDFLATNENWRERLGRNDIVFQKNSLNKWSIEGFYKEREYFFKPKTKPEIEFALRELFQLGDLEWKPENASKIETNNIPQSKPTLRETFTIVADALISCFEKAEITRDDNIVRFKVGNKTITLAFERAVIANQKDNVSVYVDGNTCAKYGGSEEGLTSLFIACGKAVESHTEITCTEFLDVLKETHIRFKEQEQLNRKKARELAADW
jgi:hypothetical protein